MERASSRDISVLRMSRERADFVNHKKGARVLLHLVATL